MEVQAQQNTQAALLMFPKTAQRSSSGISIALSLSASLLTHTEMAFAGPEVHIKDLGLADIKI